MNKKKQNIEIALPDTSSKLSLPLAEGIIAGFPSPAQDYIDLKIDLNKELINNPNSTFYGRVVGNSMIDAGIDEGDVLIIDKSITPQNNQIAICFLDGEFTVKRISIDKNECFLIPANKDYPCIKVTAENEFVVWGIVTYIIKKM